MLRRWARIAAILIVALAAAAPASAQVVQSVQIGVGAFMPRNYGSRLDSGVNDVLVADLTNANPLLFRIRDFTGAELTGEWNVAFGNHIEVGVGAGFYRRGVPSIYRDKLFTDGREIEQQLHLRVAPVSAVVRFLPFGKIGTVQPYAGVGVSALIWRYSEVGDFVDDSDNTTIFSNRYVSSGTAVGPVLLGGIRFPIQGDVYAFTFEARYQMGTGKLDPNQQFLTNEIDLSGLHLNFGILVRF